MTPILYALLAKHIKERDWDEVSDLYKRASLTNFSIGGLIAVGLWVNLPAFFSLKPELAAAHWPAIILGSSLLFGLSNSLNRLIVLNASFYRYDLYHSLSLLVLTVFTNLALIPRYEAIGAATAATVETLVPSAE